MGLLELLFLWDLWLSGPAQTSKLTFFSRLNYYCCYYYYYFNMPPTSCYRAKVVGDFGLLGSYR